MKLVIFPGGADPLTTYKDVYSLLKREAKKRKFTKTIVKNFPGHYSFNPCSRFSVKKVVNIINDSIIERETKKEPYIVLCRSISCIPFIEFLKTFPETLIYLKKVIIWGTCPYYHWYKHMIKNHKETKILFKEKKFKVKKKLFNDIYPLELSITEISKDIPFKIYITSGENDNDYPENFRELLLSIVKNPKILLPPRIKGEGHAVTKENEEYFKLIFD